MALGVIQMAKVNVLFFAQLKEALNCTTLSVDLSSKRFKSVSTLEQLRAELANTDDTWQVNMQNGRLLMAVNQTIVTGEHEIKDGDEIAFFPPVTGG